MIQFFKKLRKAFAIHIVRRSAFIKWHRFLFFLQWIKFYKLHLINALKADLWALRNGIGLSLKDRIDFYKWNSWEKYKAHHTYFYKKQKHLWLIDARYFNELDKRFNFDFDPCPYCEGEVVDGLSIEWGERNFVNPPYSQKLKEDFVKKGVEEMKKGKLCVFLIPVSTSTKLFHDWIKPNATEIDFIRGRIKFGKLDKDGNFYLPLNKHGKTQSGTKDSMVVVFDGRSATL